MRIVTDIRDGHDGVYLYAGGVHNHTAPRRQVGLTAAQRDVLDLHFDDGNLRPNDAMRLLIAANGGIMINNLGGRTAIQFRNTVVRGYLQRKRDQERRDIGNTFGEIVQFARRRSLFTPRQIEPS